MRPAETQRALAALNAELSKDQRLELRIAVNLGDVLVEGDDIYGEGVNVAVIENVSSKPVNIGELLGRSAGGNELREITSAKGAGDAAPLQGGAAMLALRAADELRRAQRRDGRQRALARHAPGVPRLR